MTQTPRHPEESTQRGEPEEVFAHDLPLETDEDWEAYEAWLDAHPPGEPEWGLPLHAESYATGEPLVVVDCFEFEDAHRQEIVDRLLTLEAAWLDNGARMPRVLLFDPGDREEHFKLETMQGIATMLQDRLRLETPIPGDADGVRDRVQAVVGDCLRYRNRTRENPIEFSLGPD